jgi:uncharacterized protein YggE
VKEKRRVMGQSLPVYVIALTVVAIAAMAAISFYSMSLIPLATRESAVPPVAESPNGLEKDILVPIRGVGLIKYVPDRATLSLSVETRGETVVEASEKNSKIVNNVIASLLANGVPEKDIKTSYLSIGPYWECKPDTGCQQNGYIAYNQITVILAGHLLRDSAKILADALQAGATGLWGVYFDLSEETKAQLRDTALKNALADASSKITSLTQLTNLKIKGIRQITVSFPEDGYYFPPLYPGRAVGAAAPEAQGPTIMPGESTYQVTVDVTYILEQTQ